jgi:hypothetical protein
MILRASRPRWRGVRTAPPSGMYYPRPSCVAASQLVDALRERAMVASPAIFDHGRRSLWMPRDARDELESARPRMCGATPPNISTRLYASISALYPGYRV